MPDIPQLTELYPGMRGYFIPGQFETKENDKSKTPRQLFVQIGPSGQEQGTFYFDPKGSFVNMLSGSNVYDFIKDPDTFDPKNPSGFEPEIFNMLQRFKNDPMSLVPFVRQHPELGIYKQETTR